MLYYRDFSEDKCDRDTNRNDDERHSQLINQMSGVKWMQHKESFHNEPVQQIDRKGILLQKIHDSSNEGIHNSVSVGPEKTEDSTSVRNSDNQILKSFHHGICFYGQIIGAHNMHEQCNI